MVEHLELLGTRNVTLCMYSVCNVCCMSFVYVCNGCVSEIFFLEMLEIDYCVVIVRVKQSLSLS